MTGDRRRVLAAGLRRFGKLSMGAVVLVSALSLMAGLVFGHPLLRSVAIGLYLTGSFLIILGFFHAHRGPLRSADGSAESPIDRSPVRQATIEEREEALSSSGVFVSLGVVLFLIAAAIDSVARPR